MESTICTYGFIPVRNNPAEQAEMTTQILFGETYQLLEQQGKWLRVSLDFDGYEGWIDAKLFTPLYQAEVDRWRNGHRWIVPGPFVRFIRDGDRSPMIIPGGSEIAFDDDMLTSCNIAGVTYNLTANYNARKPHGTIEEVALQYFSSPYLWGGRSFYGLDCSGFVQIVNKIMGRKLPRNASQQVLLGENIDFVEEVLPGDLAFFGPEESRITHVGICLGRGEIIHASGSVRIDKLDHNGIFAADRHAYTHQLRVLKRLK